MQIPKEDIELLKNLKKGDKKAFETLYKEHYNMARYFILKNSGNIQEAEDVFQEALIVLFEKSQNDQFKLTSSLKAFLYSIVRNLWLKKLRTKGKRAKVDDYEKYLTVQVENEPDQTDEKIERIMQNMNKLGEKCRKLLTGFYFYKKKMNELAEEMGYTNAANAKNQKYKCLQQLKKLVLQ